MLNPCTIEKIIPNDHSRQVNSHSMSVQLLQHHCNIQKVVDIGCGDGNSFDFFKKINQNIEWIGVDIEDSPEVKKRTREDALFLSFDGINIPLADDHVDLIFCNQVFEHVRFPELLLKDIYRVLKPGGYLVGSTSHLEPYHSNSFWNFTPYGFHAIVKSAGLELLELRPSIDSLTLITRMLVGRPKFFSRWWRKDSPLNKLLEVTGHAKNKSHREINLLKLTSCGQFCFLVHKPGNPA